MLRTTTALYNLFTQFFEKPDESSLITNGKMFRHAAASPLSGLLLNLELAHNHQGNPYLSTALVHAHQLKQLFELSDTTLKHKQTFLLSEVLYESFLTLKRLSAGSGIRTYQNIHPNTSLCGNRFLFQEALTCAVTNALEAYRGNQHKLVMITVTETPKLVTISIIDGGRGFNPVQKHLSLADGFTTKQGHSGVGMTWMKKVVVDHFGGKIKVVSRLGHGSTITWQLPK